MRELIMTSLGARLIALESKLMSKSRVLIKPLLMGIIDHKVTDEQQRQIDEAHAEGRMVIQLIGLSKGIQHGS